MRRHRIEGTPPTGKDKMEKKDKERKKINTFILICERLIRSLGTHFPIFLPRENGCTVSNHRYHIRCMEPSLRDVLIPQVIWVFCMHTVMAMAQSPVFEAYLPRLNSFTEKQSVVFLQVSSIVAINKYFTTCSVNLICLPVSVNLTCLCCNHSLPRDFLNWANFWINLYSGCSVDMWGQSDSRLLGSEPPLNPCSVP